MATQGIAQVVMPRDAVKFKRYTALSGVYTCTTHRVGAVRLALADGWPNVRFRATIKNAELSCHRCGHRLSVGDAAQDKFATDGTWQGKAASCYYTLYHCYKCRSYQLVPFVVLEHNQWVRRAVKF